MAQAETMEQAGARGHYEEVRLDNRRRTQLYKPTALRLPVLVIFLAIFALSIGLIERLLQNTSNLNVNANENGSAKSRRDVCPDKSDISSSLDEVETQFESLCAAFTTRFEPYVTSLSPARETSFSSWLDDYDSMMDDKHSIISMSNSCRATPITAEVTSTYYATAGCTSKQKTLYDPRCGIDGTISLDGTSIISAWLPCAIPPDSQMVIASNTAEATTTDECPGGTCGRPEASQMEITTDTGAAKSSYFASERISSGPNTAESSVSSAVTSDSQMVVTTATPGAKPPDDQMAVTTGTKTQTSSVKPTSLQLASNEVVYTRTFTHYTYFAAFFVAPLIAVLIKVIYEVIIASLKLMYPFQRMGSLEGATAAQSILAQYLRQSMSTDVLTSAASGHFLTLWSVIMKVFVGAAPTLATAAMSVKPTDVCPINGVDKLCDPKWIVNMTVIRIVEAILAICAVLVVVLIISTWRYGLSLPSTQSTMASVAQLMNHEPLLRDLVAIDPNAGEKDFAACIRRHRLWLGQHQDVRTGQQRRGIIGTAEGSYVQPARIRAPNASERKLRILLSDTMCLTTHLGFFILLIAYFTDYKPDTFNNFFSSQSVIAKAIFVGLATLCDVQLKDLERIIRITEPYRRLSFGNARSETTILLSLHGTCWSNLPQCLFCLIKYPDGRMIWQTIVSLVACLSDFNIVVVAGVLYTDAQTTKSFRICSWISIVITGFMLIIVATTAFWWRRQKVVREMPRRPETIGAVMSYLCGSSIVWNQLDVTGSEMKFTAKKEQRYKFGKMVSVVDEKTRWCVEIDDGDGLSSILKTSREKSGT